MPDPNGARWLRGILSAATLAALQTSLVTIIQRMGYQYFIFRGRYPQLPHGQEEFRLDNCRANPAVPINGNGSNTGPDPLHQRALQDAIPILWRDWVSYYPDYFAAARKSGLVTGVTHPVHGPLGDRSSFSFIKGVAGIQAEKEILAFLSDSQLVSCYVHATVCRIMQNRFESPEVHASARPIALTERERECLSWAATGKTAAEVAAVLSRSEATVIYHLSKARRKLGATNSRHAISKAIALKLIAPN